MMKKTLLILCCLLAALATQAQDKKIAVASAYASSSQYGYEAEYAIDGKKNTYWINSDNISSWDWPVTFILTLKEATHVDYVRYVPRQTYYLEGNWNEVEAYYCPTTTGEDWVYIGKYYFNKSGNSSDIVIGKTCGKIKFRLGQGGFYKVAAVEIEPYAIDHERRDLFAKYFTDPIFSELKPKVTSSEGIEDLALKRLVDSILVDGERYRKFRVGEYEPYMPTSTLQELLKTSSTYNNYENPTGVYLKVGESCLVAVDGIDANYPVGLTIKNWVMNENSSSYSLRNGFNQITATSEGNVFVKYYTDDYKNAPNVKIHFISAPVQGYWDQATMTNEDWKEILKGRTSKDSTILITRSEHAQLAYPVASWLEHCPTNIDSTMTLYQQMQWAQRDILGLEKYGRQVKNRQLFYATKYGFMAAGGEGSYCHVNSLGAIMKPDAKNFDFWGVGHEWGHNNQITPGFKWPGCGETTNNIYASWGQIHFTGTPEYLRLEDEMSGIDEYSNMRGGRMQTYFEEGVRKGISWQLQDGPDYHNATPKEISVVGYTANGNLIGTMVTTTSRNYDHFVKLAPFWQLNLWGTLAGKCPDIIPMVIESIRSTDNYDKTYNTSGKQQINWMKLACDSAKIDLLPFFEKAGMLRPIHAYIEDYTPGWDIIDSAMIAKLKTYVKEQGYPAFTEEINYINGHNYHIYRDCLALEVPDSMGKGCKQNGNKVVVQHSDIKNAVAFETYNNKGKLLRITMYGLGSDDEHSYTQVLYPTNKDADLNSAYIMAVGYDGTRIKIYEEGGMKEEFFTLLKEAKKYLTRTDSTGTRIGFLKPEHITEYAAFMTAMDSLIEHTDPREQPYSTWTAELKAAIATLLDNVNPMVPNRYYTLATSSDASLHMSFSMGGLTTHTYSEEEERPQSLKWKFIQSETEDAYYIQHLTTGQYITSAESGSRVKAESRDMADAALFTVEVAAPGELYIQCADNNKLRLICSQTMISVSNQAGTNARWFVQLEEELAVEEMLTLPDTSTAEELVIYYLIRSDNGEYAYASASRMHNGRIATNLYKDSESLGYWFYFKQGSQEGKYTIYNYKTQKAVTKDESKLYVNKEGEAIEFEITPDEEGMGMVLSAEEGDWYMANSATELLEMSKEGRTTWLLQRIDDINLIYEPLTRIKISLPEATLFEGKELTLSVKTSPIYATDHSVTWSSSDETVATVDDAGKVKAIAAGSAIITATANDGSGVTATCKLTVKKDNTDIDILFAPTPSFHCHGGILTIDGLTEGCNVSVYDLIGKLQAATTATKSTATLHIGASKGQMVLVKVGTQCTKILVK